MKRNYPLSWHFINGSIGFALALLITFIVLFIFGIIVGNPGLVSEQFGVPILVISCGIEVIGVAKRTSKRSAKMNSQDEPFAYGLGFHVGNIILTLVLMGSLFVIPAVVIPFSGISRENAWIPAVLSIIALIILSLTFASLRADKRLSKKKEATPEAEEQIFDDGKTRCPKCGTPYDINDYRNDVLDIFCSACKTKLQ